jgi:enamine deaminase RidA (YjgF/YER057c/UK114 family)
LPGSVARGVTAPDRTQDIRGQTRQTLERIDEYLARAGTDQSRVLTAQIWLRHIARDFASMNEIWDAWTMPGQAPARATAQCEMGASDLLVEVIVTAAARDF